MRRAQPRGCGNGEVETWCGASGSGVVGQRLRGGSGHRVALGWGGSGPGGRRFGAPERCGGADGPCREVSALGSGQRRWAGWGRRPQVCPGYRGVPGLHPHLLPRPGQLSLVLVLRLPPPRGFGGTWPPRCRGGTDLGAQRYLESLFTYLAGKIHPRDLRQALTWGHLKSELCMLKTTRKAPRPGPNSFQQLPGCPRNGETPHPLLPTSALWGALAEVLFVCPVQMN